RRAARPRQVVVVEGKQVVQPQVVAYLDAAGAARGWVEGGSPGPLAADALLSQVVFQGGAPGCEFLGGCRRWVVGGAVLTALGRLFRGDDARQGKTSPPRHGLPPSGARRTRPLPPSGRLVRRSGETAFARRPREG